jgi:hypothetical protein
MKNKKCLECKKKSEYCKKWYEDYKKKSEYCKKNSEDYKKNYEYYKTCRCEE